MKKSPLTWLLGTCALCAVGAAVVHEEPSAHRAVPAEREGDLPMVRYYGDNAEALALDAAHVAVFIEDDERASAARAALAPLGYANADVRPIYALGWSKVRLSAANANLVAAETARLADDPAIDFATPVYLDANGDAMYPTRDLIVRFEPQVNRNAALAAIEAVAPGHPAALIDENWSRMANVYRLRSVSKSGADVLRIANALAQRADVRWAEADWIVKVTVHGDGVGAPNDPSFPNCWGHDNTGGLSTCGDCLGWPPVPGVVGMDMDMLEAWQVTTGDPDIIVAIFDSGINLTHPDINQLTPGFDMTGNGTNGGPANPCDTHGTAVAGAVSAIMNNAIGGAGVAPDCRTVSVKVFTQGGADNCTGGGIVWSQVINGLDAVELLGARVTNHSYSWGSSSAAVEAKFQETRANGIIHFASAGNGVQIVPGTPPNVGQPNISYPSSIPWVNSVAALDADGTLTGFSNWGPGLFISAPGVGVCGTGSCFCGTSAASPSAAGVAALVLSIRPNLTAVQVEGILASSAMDLGNPGYDTIYGWGFVNARNALIQATGCPGFESCTDVHTTPGCSDPLCCAAICANDPFCCDVFWDQQCVDQFCPECVGGADGPQSCPGCGDCFETNSTPGCGIEDCCSKVCEADSLCCHPEFGWDNVCVGLALDLCLEECPGDGPCDQAHLGVGCDDKECCQDVCIADSFCCNEEFGWDHVCVGLAINLCDLQPTNDACEDSTEIFDGFNPFNISNASNDGPFQVECNWNPEFTKDVWHHYTATCTGLLTVDTCGNAPFQTWVGVYDSDVCPPSSISLMACDSSLPGCNNDPTLSGVFVQNGETYKVRIGAGNPSHGGGSVFVQCHTLWDNCQEPLVLGQFEGSVNFETRGATTDGAQHPGCGPNPGIYNDIWYDWTAPCTGTATIETCDNADFNTKIAVYNGCQSCSIQNIALLDCNDNSAGCAVGTSSLNIPVQEGSCYKVRLGAGAPGLFGSGQVTFSCVEVPPNDNCSDAQVIDEDIPTPYSNENATTDGIHHAECGSQILHDVWFQRVAECDGTMTVSTCGSVDYDSMIAVYKGCGCPPEGGTDGQLAGCNDNGAGCVGGGSEVTVDVAAGECYLIRVGSAPIPLSGVPATTGTGEVDITFQCNVTCPHDLNGDGSVGVPDLLELLACWGPAPAGSDCSIADFTSDENVGVPDLLELLSAWGPCP